LGVRELALEVRELALEVRELALEVRELALEVRACPPKREARRRAWLPCYSYM
jgi:hypothetical protein